MAALFFLLFLFGVFAIPPVCRPIDSSSVIFCKGIVNYNISSAYDSALQVESLIFHPYLCGRITKKKPFMLTK